MCPWNLWHLEWNTPGSPRRARMDIWRLAIETLSILSLHIFLSRIQNQIEIEIENQKKPNGPNRKLNRLKKKKIPNTLCHFGLLLGLIDVVQYLHKLRTLAFLQTQRCQGNSICQWLRYSRLSESALCKLCTSINQPYFIWATVHCHVPQPKDQGDWYSQSNTPRRRYWKEKEVVEVHDGGVVQRWSPAGQLIFNDKILVAVSTKIELRDIKNCGTGDLR